MVEIANKLLKAAKGCPVWLLSACAVTAIAACFWEPLQAGIPAPNRPYLAVAAVILTSMAVFRALAELVSLLRARRRADLVHDRDRLNRMYRPLVTLSMRVHVTEYSASGAPRLRDRLANAWFELSRCRRLRAGLRQALRAISDKQVSRSVDVEFGADFPLSDIQALVSLNPTFADHELLIRVQRADRSRCERDADEGSLTPEEAELFHYIHDEHRRLCWRLSVP